MDEGKTGLLGEGVEILHDAVLGLADIDDDLRAGGKQRLKVQLTLSAVKLTEQGEIVIFRVKVLFGSFIPF